MKAKGYTLIEILVVLTVIGILFGVGFVAYRDFSRRQALTGVTKTIQGDLRKAQQNALSGIKPGVASCNSSRTLIGYLFRVVSSSKYQIEASCSGGNAVITSVDLPSSFTMTYPSTNPILFKILGQGTNLSSNATFSIFQYGTNYSTSITVEPGGGITQGDIGTTTTPPPVPTPTPTSTPLPTPSPCHGLGENCRDDSDCCSGLECSVSEYCVAIPTPTPTPPFSGCNGGFGCMTDQDCDYWSGEQCLPYPGGGTCCKYP